MLQRVMQLFSSLIACLLAAVLVQIGLSGSPSKCLRCDSSGSCFDLCPVGKRCRVFPCLVAPCLYGSCVIDNGVCPPIPSFGPCIELCSDGGPFRPCPYGQKCCSNGCGHICRTAIYPN